MKFNISEDDKNKSGVYIVTSTATNDTYIGATNNFYLRYSQIKSEWCPLGKYIEIHGSDCLSFSILLKCNASARFKKESKFIEKMKPSLNIRGTGLKREIYNKEKRYFLPSSEMSKYRID